MASPLPYRALRARVDALTDSKRRRALAMTRAAGLADYGHLHNALVGLHYGRPWREVDYAKARAARRLWEETFTAARWLSALVQTRGPHAFDWS